MTRQYKEDEVIKEFNSIDERYRVRVIKNELGKFLDIREYVDTERFTGFTQKGIRLDKDMLKDLESYVEDIKKLL